MIPENDDSTLYVMQIFKFMTAKMETFNVNMQAQNDTVNIMLDKVERLSQNMAQNPMLKFDHEDFKSAPQEHRR